MSSSSDDSSMRARGTRRRSGLLNDRGRVSTALRWLRELENQRDGMTRKETERTHIKRIKKKKGVRTIALGSGDRVYRSCRGCELEKARPKDESMG